MKGQGEWNDQLVPVFLSDCWMVTNRRDQWTQQKIWPVKSVN